MCASVELTLGIACVSTQPSSEGMLSWHNSPLKQHFTCNAIQVFRYTLLSGGDSENGGADPFPHVAARRLSLVVSRGYSVVVHRRLCAWLVLEHGF